MLAAELPGPVKPERSPEKSADEDRDCGLLIAVKAYITMGKLEKHIASAKHAFQFVSEPLGN